LLTGAVAGLATITPAAGYVTTTSAALIGCLAGIVCYFAISLKTRMHLDDALDVWGVHGVGGFLGIVCLGIWADATVNSAGVNGLLLGNSSFFFKELAAVVITSVYAFSMSYGMLWVINKITPVKVSSQAEENGLDDALHGETAYEMI